MSGGRRPLEDVLGAGALTGLVAAAAAGAIDAVWGWAPAAQFVPGIGRRLRFVLYTALSHGLVGLVAGLVLAAVIVALARGTRLGTLTRFAFGYHDKVRAADRRDAVVGVSVALAGVPAVAAAIDVAYRIGVPTVLASHAKGLAVLVVIAVTLALAGGAVIVAFALARPIEMALRPLAARWAPVSSVWAPFVTAGVVVAIALGLWAHAEWETVEQLHLRGAVVALVAAVLAIPASGVAWRVSDFARLFRPALRWAVWGALLVLLPVLVLATGGNAAVIKAASAYTGLGGPVARMLRKAADRDHDGYARWLGGGDCDDSDPSVHPGAPEIPDDGIDQNCIGGDAPSVPPREDVAFSPVPATVPKDFDVLLITIDTTRADHLGMYGYKRPTSPNLDKLAADGTVFENGWAHAPSTRYSMPAILTGRLPLDVYYDYSVDGWPGLAQKATTIAELLAPLGFATGAITNYDYFERFRHFDQGFAEYDNSDARLHHGVAGAGPEQTAGSSSKEQADKAIAFVDRHAAERWFLWVHFYDPHYAYEPHPGQPSFGSDKEALYDGEIRYTDTHIGRLLDDLRAKGLYDKTVVVVTGDHGEGFGEHGVLFHGYHLYAAQTKVPLVVKVPGMAPRRASTPAGHVDIMPTLVNLAGGQPNPDMMGRSLVDVLGGKDLDRVVHQQLSYENNHEMRAGVDRQCHVIYNVSPETSWEVYRVDKDPMETEDLAGDDDACAATRRAVEKWYDASTVPAGAAEALLNAKPAIATPLDADFGDGARLLALDVPKTAKMGDTITLTWTWEARAKIPPGWKVFAHLDGPHFVNGDHTPARPFEWWKPGQFIQYPTTIALPRIAGRYTLHVGVFHGNDRMPARCTHAPVDHNSITAATIEVTP